MPTAILPVWFTTIGQGRPRSDQPIRGPIPHQRKNMPTIPEILHGLSPAGRERLLGSMPEHQLRAAERSFPEWAHLGQLAPASTPTGDDWRTWVLMAGRGFGKTRAGAEWVLDCVRGGSSPVGLPASPSRRREG